VRGDGEKPEGNHGFSTDCRGSKPRMHRPFDSGVRPFAPFRAPRFALRLPSAHVVIARGPRSLRMTKFIERCCGTAEAVQLPISRPYGTRVLSAAHPPLKWRAMHRSSLRDEHPRRPEFFSNLESRALTEHGRATMSKHAMKCIDGSTRVSRAGENARVPPSLNMTGVRLGRDFQSVKP
jgi:hypothetical protein